MLATTPTDLGPRLLWPRRRATMPKWQDIESRTQQVKRYSCTAYIEANVDLVGLLDVCLRMFLQ
jgi:hypothetical protein